MAEVTRIPLAKRPSAWAAMYASWIGLALLIIGAFAEFAAPFRAAFFMAAGGAFAIAAVNGVIHWRLKQRAATGLRLDAQGVSGYALPVALRWDEIDSFGLVEPINGSVSVGVSVRDPRALGAHRRTMIQPVEPSEPWKYHLSMRTSALDADPRDLLEQLRDWHARFGG